MVRNARPLGHEEQMTVVFCIDDNPHYLMLFRAAVRSLLALHRDVRCVCVYSGANAEVIAAVRAEGVELALYQNPVLHAGVIPKRFHRAIGAYLKLELALVPELADEERVLYCDVDVLFLRELTPLKELAPAYMGMAREATSPFFPSVEQVDYVWKERRYQISMPFPIWTFSSGVVLFNLDKLRRHEYIHNFLAFCAQTTDRIDNLDQSLLNYFFGKRITRLEARWNRPPYNADCLSTGHILHFHGPKPWDMSPSWRELRIHDFMAARDRWLDWLTAAEARTVAAWEQATLR